MAGECSGHAALGAGELRSYLPTSYDKGRYTFFNEAIDFVGTLEARILQGRVYSSDVYGSGRPIVTPDALAADGSLLPDIDLMRGEGTTYIKRLVEDDPHDIATMRLKYPLPGESYKCLPSYRRCIGNALPGAEKKFEALVEQGYEIGEAGALGAASKKAAYLIFRQAMRYCVELAVPQPAIQAIKPQPRPKKQALLMGAAYETYRRFTWSMGKRNFARISEDSFFDPRVNYPLVFSVVDTLEFNNELCRDYLEARERRDEHWQHIAKYFLFFTEGLSENSGHMSAETWASQQELRTEVKYNPVFLNRSNTRRQQ